MKPAASALVQEHAHPSSLAGPVKWALGALSLSMLLSSLGTSIANVGLPALAKGFGVTFQAVQWVVIAYLLAITSLIVSVGRLGDVVGQRRLLLLGLFSFSVGSLLCGLAPSLGLLIAARAVQGIGAATMMALTLALATKIVPKPQIGHAMGLLGTMSAIGTALGPSVGGLLIAVFGWRAIFLIHVPFAIGTLVLVYRCLPDDELRDVWNWKGFDVWGTALWAGTLAAYALAMTVGHGHFSGFNLALLMLAGAAGVLFAYAESKASAPLIRLASLRDRSLGSALAASLVVSAVLMTTLVVGPFYLSRALGLTPALVGMVMSLGPVAAALTGVPAGRLTDRWGARRVIILGLAGIAIGSAFFTLLPVSLGISGYVTAIVATTVGYAFFQTANNTAVMDDVPPDERGVASGLLNLSRNLGLITGASVMGAVFAVAAGTQDITHAEPAAVVLGMRTTFAVAGLLVMVALFVTTGIRPVGRASARGALAR